MNSGNCANDGRRFALLVTDCFLFPNKNGILVTGTIHGQIKTGDDVYLVDPEQRVLTSRVVGISLLDEDGEIASDSAVNEAANQAIALHLASVTSEEEVPKYTVVTSLRPQQAVDLSRGIENGQLIGLLMEFATCSQDPQYMSALVYSLCHSHYLAVTYVSGSPAADESGNITINADTDLEFPTLNDSKDVNTTMLPIFTDWASLQLWQEIFHDVRQPRFTVMRFPNVVSVCRNLSGAIINAYGPGTLVLPNDFITRITATKGYQDEFGMNADKNKILSETKLDKDQQIRIVVPTETDELRLIREEILSDVKSMSAVREVYLMIKLDSENEPAYYCVADCPQDDVKSVFEKLARDTTPFLHQIKRIEFLPAAALTIPDSIAAVCQIYPEDSIKAYANGDRLQKPSEVSLSSAKGQVSYEGHGASTKNTANTDYDLEANEKSIKEEAAKK